MEIQFQKTTVPYLQTVLRQTQTQELTQQVRLPDTMPDIGSVLASWGQILIRGKEWRSGSFNVTGGVTVWMLYAPEDGSRPQSMEIWLPFQMKWDIPETEYDGIIEVNPTLHSVDTRTLSDRKLMVRATVGVLAHGMLPSEAAVYAPKELPQDVQVLRNTYPMLLPVEAGEKAFSLEESLTLPDTQTPLQELVRYTAVPQLMEHKIVADKLVIRGTITLDMLYLGTDEQLHRWSMELPFSQYTQLDIPYESSADAWICFALTGLELERSETNSLTVKVGLTAQYRVIDKKEISVVEDMYSPNRSTKCNIEQLQLPSVLDRLTYTIPVEAPINDQGQLLDAVLYTNPPQIYIGSDRKHMELSGAAQLLTADMEGNLQGSVSRWEDKWDMDVQDTAQVQLTVGHPEKTYIAVNGLRAELPMEAAVISQASIPMIVGAELGEWNEADPSRPSIVLRTAGTQRLWDLAKIYGSTVDAIRQANHLQQEPAPDQMLLIPVN